LSTQWVDAARRVAATTAEIAATRLELATLELVQHSQQVSRRIAAAVLVLTGLGLGSMLAAMALAWWLGPPAGVWVLGGAAALWLAVAAVAAARYAQLSRDDAAWLPDTLAQLREDVAALVPAAAPVAQPTAPAPAAGDRAAAQP
jgi:uncharacterized membrane protein YqjE